MRVAASVGIAVVLAMSACGDAEAPPYPSDGTDEGQIRAVVGIANAALANRDGYLMCREVFPRDGYDDAAFERCGKELTEAMEDSDGWDMSFGEPEDIVIRGDSATALMTIDGEESRRRFVRQGGRWWMRVLSGR